MSISEIETTIIEQWRAVPGYEGRYEVSDHGHVRSLGFYINHPRGKQVWRAGRALGGFAIQPHGYRAVELSSGSGLKTFKIHRLVLLAFVGPPPAGKKNGLHKDDDPENNHLGNLRWGSHRENTYDSIENGGHVQARKQRCPLTHLLVEPNLVPSTLAIGGRGCLACKRTDSSHKNDARLALRGLQRTRNNRGADGFMRRFDESFEDEANRRYVHIMRNYDGEL